MSKELIIVTIPAYNEERTIGLVIEDIKKVMDENKYNYKILVIDDGSRDKTAQISTEKGAQVFSHQFNLGLAEAFRTEMKKCLELNADIIVHTDADGQYLAKDIPRLINEIKNNYDLVLGSRFKGHIEEMPLIKRLGNKAFARVISKITKFPISDPQTGFRAFTKQVAEKIKVQSTHTYTQEAVIRAVREKFKVKEIPVYFAKREGKSRLISNPFEYAVKAWINILRVYRDYEPLKFFGSIGLFFILTGFAIGLWLFSLLLTTGKIGHTPSTILSMLLIITGTQIVLFGFFADSIRK